MQTNRHTDRRTDRQTNRLTDKRTDSQTDGTDSQTDPTNAELKFQFHFRRSHSNDQSDASLTCWPNRVLQGRTKGE